MKSAMIFDLASLDDDRIHRFNLRSLIVVVSWRHVSCYPHAAPLPSCAKILRIRGWAAIFRARPTRPWGDRSMIQYEDDPLDQKAVSRVSREEEVEEDD